MSEPIAPPTDHLALYIDLTRRKRTAEESLREVNRQLADAEQAVLADFSSRGTQSINRDGMTVFVRRELAVEQKDGADLRLAIEQTWPDVLGPNWQKLKGRIREALTREDIGEWTPDATLLPGPIQAAIDVREIFRLGARASAKPRKTNGNDEGRQE